MISMRYLCILISTVILFSLTGCAYFNTFYLAKHHFNEAERLRKQKNGIVDVNTSREYDDAIEWASEILREYADSRYVDDSLFIIGMSNYYQEEYVQARTKFDELLRYFPDSELALSAQYYKALSLVELDDTDEALMILIDLNNTDDRRLRGMAGVSIAQIYRESGDWQELADAADHVIAGNPEDEQYVEAVYLKGKALFELGQYNDSIAALTDIADKKLKSELRFQVNTLKALSEANLGRYDEAMEELVAMQNRGEFIDYAPRIRLEIGTIYELQGNRELAIDTYTNLAGDFPDSLAAKEAWYNVGTLLLEDMANAREAQDAFKKVREGRTTTAAAWYADAQIKTVQIDSLISKLDAIETIERRLGRIPEEETVEPDSALALSQPDNVPESEEIILPDFSGAVMDSVDNPESTLNESQITNTDPDMDPYEQLAAARYALAEVYTYSFDRPDSAMTQYQLIAKEVPGSEYAIKSQYFMELNALREEGIIDDEQERDLMERLIAEYPSSEFIQELKVYLGMIETTPDAELIAVAERSKLEGEPEEDWIALYQQVIDNYPRTKNAYRARLNIAYAREHLMGDMDGAIQIYESIADAEPTENNRQYVEIAQGKLDMLEREERILEDIENNIEYYQMVIRDLKAGAGITAIGSATDRADVTVVEAGYTGMRKIRERNARIRSRYYTD